MIYSKSSNKTPVIIIGNLLFLFIICKLFIIYYFRSPKVRHVISTVPRYSYNNLLLQLLCPNDLSVNRLLTALFVSDIFQSEQLQYYCCIYRQSSGISSPSLSRSGFFRTKQRHILVTKARLSSEK